MKTNLQLHTLEGLAAVAQPSLTECQLLPGVRRQREPQQRHAGDEDAGDDQIEEVVESSPSDVDSEGDVHVWLGTTVVCNTVLLPGHSCSQTGSSNVRNSFTSLGIYFHNSPSLFVGQILLNISCSGLFLPAHSAVWAGNLNLKCIEQEKK